MFGLCYDIFRFLKDLYGIGLDICSDLVNVGICYVVVGLCSDCLGFAMISYLPSFLAHRRRRLE